MVKNEDVVTDGELQTFVESVNSRLRTMQWIIGGYGAVITLYLLAAVPWAIRIESNIAKLTTKVEAIHAPPDWFLEKVVSLEADVRELQKEVASMKRN